MKNKFLMKDIAEQAGTSITTVSFVINGKAKEKHISEKIIKKVLKAVSDMDYQPNSIAQSLRTGKSRTIGFVVDDISTPFFSAIGRSINEKAAERGYNVIYGNTGNDPEKAAGLLRALRDRRVDGYIIAPAEGTDGEVTGLIETGMPVVIFNNCISGLSVDCVLTDNFRSARNAVFHLIERGFGNIAFVTLESRQEQLLERMKGYTSVMTDTLRKENILRISNRELAKDQIMEFLILYPDVDAVIFASNFLTLEALKLSRTHSPNLLSGRGLVSFDDFDLLALLDTPVTAIAQHIEGISDNIIHLLFNRLNAGTAGGSEGCRTIEVPAILNIRESTSWKNSLAATPSLR